MGEMIVIRPISTSGHFLYRLLSSVCFIEEVNSVSEGVKLPRPPVDRILNTSVTIPPLEEQKRISKYLDQKTEQIDSLVKSENQRIKLLKEYRQSLISSVVTGKVRITEGMVIQ